MVFRAFQPQMHAFQPYFLSFDSLQTAFFKISKDNATFESPVLVKSSAFHFAFLVEVHTFHYKNTETSFLFQAYYQVRSFFSKKPIIFCEIKYESLPCF